MLGSAKNAEVNLFHSSIFGQSHLVRYNNEDTFNDYNYASRLRKKKNGSLPFVILNYMENIKLLTSVIYLNSKGPGTCKYWSSKFLSSLQNLQLSFLNCQIFRRLDSRKQRACEKEIGFQNCNFLQVITILQCKFFHHVCRPSLLQGKSLFLSRYNVREVKERL